MGEPIQFVSCNRAGGCIADGANGVSAAGWTMGNCAEVRFQIIPRGNIAGLFALFQGPLLFGRVNLAKVVDTGICLRRFTRFDEVGNGDGHHHRH